MTAPDLTKLTVGELRIALLTHTLISEHTAEINELARKAQANDALMDAAQRVADRCPKPRPGVAQWTSEGEMAIEALRAALAAAPAPSSSGAPAPDHIAGVSKMVPVLYHLDDGKVAAAMLVAKNTLVVDLMSGDGPSVVGKAGWFEAGYVATYGGLVPEAADEGTEPGQWSYGVRQLPQFLPIPVVCDLCNKLMPDGTDGHGLGECAPVCPTCDGSGTVEKCDPPGEHANRYQEPCPRGCKPAPADSQREAAVDALATAIVRSVSELPDRSSPADWPEAMIVEPGELRSIILQVCAAPEPAPAEPEPTAAPTPGEGDRAWITSVSLSERPADAQREAAIEEWRKGATSVHAAVIDGGGGLSSLDDVFELHADTITEGLALMRSAPPAPVAPVTDAVPPDLAAALAWWGAGTEPKTMAEAVEKARSYRNDAHELADVAFELRNQPDGNQAEQVRRLLAPVTEGEVEAAIEAFSRDAYAHAAGSFMGIDDDDDGEHPAVAAKRSKDTLHALIARRVAEARGAGLREFKAWFAEKATWTIEATAEAPAMRGFSVAPRDIDTQIDRLLAAPPASKLAEEPAQEDDGPCLSALLANMRMEMSDGANGMRTPREEAIAAVVECVARRIEALENNKEAGK